MTMNNKKYLYEYVDDHVIYSLLVNYIFASADVVIIIDCPPPPSFASYTSIDQKSLVFC